MASKDMVTFLMPDGTEVSNDPRFGLEEALKAAQDSYPNRGDVGITAEEQAAQTQVEHAATLNSGQPGVGENAVPDDVVKDAYGPLGSPAQQRQVEDRKLAEEAGAHPNSTSVEDAEPVDSNKAVEEAREAKAKRLEAEKKALDALAEAGQEEGSTDKPYSQWSAKQLKAELARRNASRDNEEDQLTLEKGMTKADVAAMLEDDDAARSGGEDGVTGAPVTQD